MSLEKKIYELRQQKLRDIEALGQESYPHKYAFTHTVPQILAEFSHKTAEELESGRVQVKVAGRMISLRLRARPDLRICNRVGSACRSIPSWMLSATRVSRSTGCWTWVTTLA